MEWSVFVCLVRDFAWIGFYPSVLHGEDDGPVISDAFARFNCIAIELVSVMVFALLCP